jgi:microcystin-dependent protein
VGYYAGLPLGAIIAYPSDEVPGPSFKLCDGRLMDKASYKDLFDLIKYTYGGSGNLFNLPNIKGRTIVGFNSTDTAFDSLGKVGGEKNVTLGINHMPGHTHPIPAPTINVTGSVSSTFTGKFASITGGNHQHTFNDEYFVDSGDSSWMSGGDRNANKSTGKSGTYSKYTNGTGEHTHNYTPEGTVYSAFSGSATISEIATQSTGGTQPHNNLQPYIVLNYFIKVTKESSQYTSDPLVISDIRVKRNIEMLNSNQSIEMIRLLQPKRYEYIDRNMSVFKQHIGFIAQEAKLCIPESVCTKRDYIPNIYSMAKLTSSGPPGNALLTSVQHPIAKLIRDELLRNTDVILNTTLPSCLKGIKLKMFNKSKECFYVCCVESIDDYNVLVEPLDATTTAVLLSADYFIYGQEIEDYHYMNNDAVFSTLVSAFQALDKTCNELDKTCKRQELLINALIEKNNLKL